jgi:hypothetical protein
LEAAFFIGHKIFSWDILPTLFSLSTSAGGSRSVSKKGQNDGGMVWGRRLAAPETIAVSPNCVSTVGDGALSLAGNGFDNDAHLNCARVIAQARVAVVDA